LKYFAQRKAVAGLAAVALIAAACGGSSGATEGGSASSACTPPDTPVLNFVAYSTPREAYGKIIPAFQEKWKAEHNDQQVLFRESYGSSTTQAQSIVGGFDADVAALSLAPDLDIVKEAGLITHDWEAQADGGMVSTSVVAFDVRPGNPKGIRDFHDLTQSGLEVLTPDPASSGGARWNIVAAYGASLRGYAGGAKDDPAEAQGLLQGIFGNVTVLDKSARDSIKNFESGNGDVAITYENEILTAQDADLPDEMVIPPSTVLIENPVAVVDKYAEQHCVADVAKEFVEFLHTDEAKELYTTVGFLRPTDLKAAQEGDGEMFAPIEDLWTVEDLGGWDAIEQEVFGDQGAFTKAFEAAQS
jgi:sulfate transport system substrate-binding protein